MTGILPGKNPGYYSINDKNNNKTGKKMGVYSSNINKIGGKIITAGKYPTPEKPPSPPCCATCATCSRCVGAANLIEENIEL